MAFDPATYNEVKKAQRLIENISAGGSVAPFNPVTLQSKDSVTQGEDLWINPTAELSEEDSGFSLASATLDKQLDLDNGLDLRDLSFSDDGTFLYVVTLSDDIIRQYTCAVPFDLDTATLSGSIPVGTSEPNPNAVEISSDGKNLFFGGETNHQVYRFILPEPHELVGAVLDDNSLNNAGQDIHAIRISPDGTDMLILGVSGSLRKYALLGPHTLLGANLEQTITLPNVLGTTNFEGLAVSRFGTTIYACVSSRVGKYTMPTALDLDNLTYSGQQIISPGGATNNIFGVDMDSQGNMYLVRDTNPDMILSFNSPTLTITSSPNTESGVRASQGSIVLDVPFNDAFTTGTTLATTNVEGCIFNSDGTKYIHITNFEIIQHNLATPYDIGSVTSSQSFNTNVNDPTLNLRVNGLKGLGMTSDGTKIFVLADNVINSSNIGVQDDVIRSYTLSVPGDVTSATLDAQSFLVGGLIGGTFPDPGGFVMDETASNMYLIGFTGSASGAIRRIQLSTPGDLSTASNTESLTPPNTTLSYRSLHISEDGTRFYLGGSTLYKYEMTTPFSLSGMNIVGQINPSTPDGIAISPDQSIMVLAAGNTSAEYDSSETTLAPNPESFRIGFASDASAADTDFVALLDTKGTIPYPGALVGDFLTESGSFVQLNGLGSVVGYCVRDDFIEIIGE